MHTTHHIYLSCYAMATVSSQVNGRSCKQRVYVFQHNVAKHTCRSPCFVLPACMYVWIHIGDTIIRAPRPVVTFTGYRQTVCTDRKDGRPDKENRHYCELCPPMPALSLASSPLRSCDPKEKAFLRNNCIRSPAPWASRAENHP